jgi:hypothetical protein
MGFYMEKEKTGSTPYVLIDEDRNYMRFEGESFHENVIDFFRDIIDWLKRYLESNFESFTFDCEMKYINSSTTKLLFNMLQSMDDCSAGGSSITVNWIVSDDNDIIMECGEDFKEEMPHITFNILPHSS